MSGEMTFLEMLLRLVAASGLAALIGLERELRGRAAGLRTHMLVSLGAATFLLLAFEILSATAHGDPSARVDPVRIIEGVIGGIGFLGAGSIIRSEGSVEGLTTGAAIWIAGAVGLTCGMGNYVLASTVTVLALVIIVPLGFFEQRVIKKRASDE